MPVEVLLPALSPTMTEGTLAKWLKKEGETVKAGDVIAEVETDKATMEIEAIDDGTLQSILIPEGTEGIPINTPIGIIVEEGVDDESKINPVGDLSTDSLTNNASHSELPPDGKKVVRQKTEIPQSEGQQSLEERIFISPLAKRMAAQESIDISTITGTGPKGRIVKADILKVLDKDLLEPNISGKIPMDPRESSKKGSETSAPFHTIGNTNMRKIISRRLVESKSTVPHFYLTLGMEIDKLLEARTILNTETDNFAISINDFFIRATALALKAVPSANASWGPDETLYYDRVDMAVAVAVPGGLLTPVVKDAGNKGLASISQEMKELATKAKAGELLPEEYQGGTFSISNLGMYGVREFSAVINPPQAGILAVGASTEQAVVKNSAIAIATCVDCTLSCDHRVIDGATGAELLNAIKGLIENPLNMLL